MYFLDHYMGTYRKEVAAGRPLENLGISEPEERIYRWLLKHRNAPVAEAAHALSLAPGKAKRLLETLEAKGLIMHTPERPRRYILATPDIALDALILQRQKDLQDARLAVQELKNEASSEQGDESEQLVEMVSTREAQNYVLDQMSRLACHEFLSLSKLPLLVSRVDLPIEKDRLSQKEARTRGVSYRSVVDVELLNTPNVLSAVRADMENGEEVRVTSYLPFKLVIVDRRIALVLRGMERSGGQVLIVRSTVLVDSLYALFELFWEGALPVPTSGGGELLQAMDESNWLFNEKTHELISLLAAGLNDQRIASELGITTRTLRRRVTELMRMLNVRTRFQVGWRVALRLAASNVLNNTSGAGDLTRK